MSRARPKGATPVASVLSTLLGKLQHSPRPSIEEMVEVWQRLAGADAAQHSWPKNLKAGRLVVEVENSGWMHALGMKKAQLLEGLIELMGAGRVEQLAFRIGERADA